MRTERFLAYEYYGTGDPFFGGAADDRTLGKEGSFLTGSHAWDAVASFPTAEEAQSAGERALNRRKDALLSSGEWLIPDWVTVEQYHRAIAIEAGCNK